jgi:hypothetical protein
MLMGHLLDGWKSWTYKERNNDRGHLQFTPLLPIIGGKRNMSIDRLGLTLSIQLFSRGPYGHFQFLLVHGARQFSIQGKFFNVTLKQHRNHKCNEKTAIDTKKMRNKCSTEI